MGTKLFIVIISLVWLLFAFFIWPTPYHVEVFRLPNGQPSVAKVNRFKGEIVSMKMNRDAYKQMVVPQRQQTRANDVE